MRLPRLSAQQRRILSLIAFVVVAGLWWWSQQGSDGGGDTEPDTRARDSQTASPTADASSVPATDAAPDDGGGTDPDSGLAWVDVDALPGEARDTLALIDAGGPYPYDRDGVTFENREGILPDQQTGYYREYTVPTPGEDDRGARRIVTGGADEFYWTADHYASFERIRR